MPRYFYSELARTPIVAGHVNIVFQKTGIIGSNVVGVYAADNRDELAVLAGAVSQRAGVIEISKEDYDQQVAQKKTIPSSQLFSTSNPVPQLATHQPSRVAERAGAESVVSQEEQKSSDIKAGKVEDPRSVIKIDKVNPPSLVSEAERVAPVATPQKRSKSKQAA